MMRGRRFVVHGAAGGVNEVTDVCWLSIADLGFLVWCYS